jgi:hypothetical protein
MANKANDAFFMAAIHALFLRGFTKRLATWSFVGLIAQEEPLEA